MTKDTHKMQLINFWVQEIYTHQLSGNFIRIEISRHIDLDKLSHLELSPVWWGSWETPAIERVKGFSLRALSKGNKHGQHIENFYRDRMTDDQILEISKGLANFLSVPLCCEDRKLLPDGVICDGQEKN